MASVDLMAGAIAGKTIDEALELVKIFQGMMKGEAEFPPEQRKLNVMKGVAQFPIRIKCANLGWHTMRAALQFVAVGVAFGVVAAPEQRAAARVRRRRQHGAARRRRRRR